MFLKQAIKIKNGKNRPKATKNGAYPIYGSNGIISYSEKYNAPPGTIIIGRVGSYCGSLYYTKSPCWVTDNAMMVNPKEGYDSKYLFYLFNTLNLNERSTGSGQPLLNQSIINSIETNIPPLPEQKRIANILSSFDNKIELLREQNKTLENIAQTIFKQWFIDFNFPDSNGKPYKDNGGKMIDSELGLIPEGWEVGELGKYLDIELGGTPSRKEDSFWGGIIPWINSGELNNIIIQKPTEYISELGLKKSAAKILPIGTVLIAITGATMGKFSILNLDCSFNQSVVGIKPNNLIHTSFLYLFIGSNIERIINSATGGAQQHINKNVIEKTTFVVPQEQYLKNFYKKVDSLFSKILLNTGEIKTNEILKDVLLNQLII
jgi:type I restriction enzyme, S subunit